MDAYSTNMHLARFCGFELDPHARIITRSTTRSLLLPRYTDDR